MENINLTSVKGAFDEILNDFLRMKGAACKSKRGFEKVNGGLMS